MSYNLFQVNWHNDEVIYTTCGEYSSYDLAYLAAHELSAFSGVCVILRGSWCFCQCQHYLIECVSPDFRKGVITRIKSSDE
jgi:hypothetical protein